MTDEKSPLEVIEARREARKAELKKQRDAQRAIDLEALNSLEIEYGDENISALDIAFLPGQVTLAAVRTPTSPEVKRYQSRIRPTREGRLGDSSAAAEEIGASCVVYPSKGEQCDALFAARPGLLVNLGMRALDLSTGKAEAEGKG